MKGLLLVAMFVLVSPAMGAVFTVNTTEDYVTGSMRWAIIQANTRPGPDSVRV
jgi:hypothetical protein